MAHHRILGRPEFAKGGTRSSSHLLCVPTSSSSLFRSGRCRAQSGGQPGGRSAGRVVVTREHGKNGKLMKALVSVPWLFHHPRGSSGFTSGSSAIFFLIDRFLGRILGCMATKQTIAHECTLCQVQESRGIGCVELPLIEHREGPDLPKLVQTLRGISSFIVHSLPFFPNLCVQHPFLAQ